MSGGIHTQKKRDLTNGPIARTLLVLAWPVMLSNLFQTIYNLVDTLWLGRLGKVAIAAPTIVWPLVFLMISVGAGITIAGTALVAQYTGARREEEANHAAGQVFAFTGILALVLGISGVFIARPLMVAMGAGPDLLPAATSYLRIIYGGIPAMFGMFIVTSLLNGVGDTMTPMKLMGVSVVLNIVLDPLFIFGWGPFPAWGITGAAVATVISRGLVAIYGLYLLFAGKVGIHLRLRHLRLEWAMVKHILVIGGPASLGQSGTALGFSIMTGILARFGTAVVSAFGIGNRIISIATMPAMGLGQAAATMVGQNLGAKETKRAEHSAWTAIWISTAFLLAASAAVYFLRTSLVRVFINDPEVISLGASMFAITAMAFPFMGILQVIIGAYQGSGHTVYSMFFSLFRLWALRIPLVYFLGFSLAMGADGVWWAMFISNFGASAVSIGFFLSGNWKHRIIKEAPITLAPVTDDARESEVIVEETRPLQR
ncbi:MAG TPA: MATE family efflux transporter [Candidatus Acetothermia bacterium]|nr:MATE family efflux transporter [Candidatus Acetothermia bacterium]HEX32683.1 MATE family efflux transporter [Candidatus Acetothermia bacterium]